MKIATLNIDWFKKSKDTQQKIIDAINEQNFDFIIITENILSFQFDDKYFAYHTAAIPTNTTFQHLHYGEYLKGETPVRTSIYSKHKSIEQLNVCDAFTSICHKFLVDKKEVIIYATIVGTYGIKYQKEIAQVELDNLKTDIQNISVTNENIFIVGDFNTSFYKYEKRELSTIKSRKEFINFTDKNNIHRTTESIKENIDHIFVSQKLMEQSTYNTSIFLEADMLKDQPHKGISLNINFEF